MDINQTYCGHHFAKYTITESLYCMPETNVMLYVSCALVKKRQQIPKVYQLLTFCHVYFISIIYDRNIYDIYRIFLRTTCE